MADAKTLQLLDWRRVVEALAKRARTPYGYENLLQIAPLPAADADVLRRRTTAWRELLRKNCGPVLTNVADVRAPLSVARLAGPLDAKTLLDVAANAELVADVAAFLSDSSLPTPLRERPTGFVLFEGDLMRKMRALAGRIFQVLDPSGAVRADASETLARTVHEERSRSAALRAHAEALLDDARIQPLLRDRYVTQREGRFVLPIRIEQSRHVKGIVHDASASGATIYLEPEELTEANNRLAEVRARIREEIARIMAELTALVAQTADAIVLGLRAVGEIDAEIARAECAEAWHAVEPVDATHIRLLGVRQPLLLLRGLDVVPIHIEHPGAGRGVILSGPNAGGKTAALKTLGLVFLLAQAGCHIPAERAELPLTWCVEVELGDPQSLGEDLSTFSGHLARLAEIGRLAGPQTLLLVDEILKGTDPADGAPMARAWLETMLDKGAALWVTTHYGSIKALPAMDARFVAARTAFEYGQPAFHIHYGEVGASYAFETAERYGFPSDVLARARIYRERTVSEAERTLSEIDQLRRALARAREEAERERAEQKKLRDRLQAELELLQREKKALVRRAAEATLSQIERARAVAERAEEEVKRRASEGRKKRIELGQTRANLERTLSELEVSGQVDFEKLQVSDLVYSRRFKRNGVVVRKEKQRVVLKIGNVQVACEAADLAPAQPEARGVSLASRCEPTAHPVPETLDIRGLRLDEARRRLEAWIDGALRARQAGKFRLLHGIGTGALRDGLRAHLREFLPDFPWRPGNEEEGGDAVTILELG